MFLFALYYNTYYYIRRRQSRHTNASPISFIVCKCLRVSARVAFCSFVMLMLSTLANCASALNTLWVSIICTASSSQQTSHQCRNSCAGTSSCSQSRHKSSLTAMRSKACSLRLSYFGLVAPSRLHLSLIARDNPTRRSFATPRKYQQLLGFVCKCRC